MLTYQVTLDAIGSNEDKADFHKFLSNNKVPFRIKLKEAIDPTNPLTLILLSGLTPTLIRMLYDYMQGRKDKGKDTGFRLLIKTEKEIIEITARTTPKDLV